MPSGRKHFTNLKDKKIRIVGVKQSSGPTGTPIDDYYDLCGSVWANYRSMSGDEYFAAAAHGVKAQVIFTVNWHEDIEERMYVLFRNKAYRITYIDDLEGYKKDLKLHCETSSSINANERKKMLAALEGGEQ